MLDTNYIYNSYHTNSYSAAITVSILVELEFRDVGFLWREETGEPGEKPSKQGKNQHQTLPRYGLASPVFCGEQLIYRPPDPSSPRSETIRRVSKIYHHLLYLCWHGGGDSNIGRFCNQLNPLNGGLALPASPEPHTLERPRRHAGVRFCLDRGDIS